MDPSASYRFLTPIELDLAHDDARYPRLTSHGEVRFVPEPGDGTQRFFAAESLTITHRPSSQKVLSIDDVRLVCCLTDTRLVITYREFAARGQWTGFGLGGFAIAAAVNHRNRKAAARDQAGHEAAMQVRLQWVAEVTAGTALGLLRSEVVSLAIKVGAELFDITVRLVKGGPTAVQIGTDLLRLTAEHWLRARLPDTIALTPDERAGFERLTSARLTAEPKQTSSASPPCWLTVSDTTARQFLPAPASAPPRSTPIRPRYDGVGR